MPAVAAGRWLEVGAESNSRSRDGYSACKSGDVLIHVGAVWRSHNSPGNSRRARVAADVPAFLGPVRLTSRVLILFTANNVPGCNVIHVPPSTLASLIYMVTVWGSSGALMKSSIVKRSVVIGGHKTSVSLEEPFWTDLKQIARTHDVTLSALITHIDGKREQSNLSSGIRVFVLRHSRLAQSPGHGLAANATSFSAAALS